MYPSPTPNTSDAWLLLALAFGRGDAEGTISSADYLNHAIPNPEEWEHAAQVLGCRGLLEAGEPLPLVTAIGEEIARIHGGFPIGKFDSVLEQIRACPVVGEPVPTPDLDLLRRGYAAYSAKAKAIGEQYIKEHGPELKKTGRDRKNRTILDRLRNLFRR